MVKAKKKVVEAITKLDIGCGKNKKAGFTGVDQYAMDGVDVIHDIRKPWPFPDDSIEEVHCSHFLEHLTGDERVFFMNELYRVLKEGGKAAIITPHWCSNRAYGDFTHQWPPVSEMFYYYLSRDWRTSQAPHTDIQYNKEGYNCNFQATWGYSFDINLSLKHPEYQQFAMQNYKEAAQDTHAMLVKLK